MACKASVIVPIYNAEKTLRRCVESVVLGQERDIEVILVDDCSKDRSWELCQKLAQEFSNVTSVQNERNSGVSFTRNRGLELAQGNYVLFVDSDDWVSGRYVSRLVGTAAEHQTALTLCGFRFHEEVAGYQVDYLWDHSGESLILIQQDQFFGLQEKVLLQSPCNKAFLRSVVLERHICFDETQSMGEDFQFVLDYMEAACIQQCVIVNEPLYHYIRANSTSLMSKFGLVERENELERLAQLKRICGCGSSSIHEQYTRAVDTLKKNYVYHTMHSNTLSRAQKIQYIQDVLGNENAVRTYRQYRLLIRKERLAQFLNNIQKLPDRFYGRLQRVQLQRFILRQREQFAAAEQRISIISQNCIGGVLYHDLGLEFSSPTINLFFRGPDFVRFVLDLEKYFNLAPIITWGESYPIGHLNDVEIHFMHYDTCSEAKAAWNRRKTRVDWEHILVLCTDMEDFTDEVFENWKKISYPKILFTSNAAFAGEQDTVYYPQYQSMGHVPDLIPKREFYRSGKVMTTLNHLCKEKL